MKSSKKASSGKVVLLSIDFRSSQGGISRLANLIYTAMKIDKVYSLNGNNASDSSVVYFQNNKLFFLLKCLLLIYFTRPRLILFDHLNIARLLAFIPSGYLQKTVIYLHDEEAWKKETGFYKVALSKATHILCNSDFTKRKFLSLNPEYEIKTKTCLPGNVHPSLIANQVSEKYAFWFENNKPYCLFVGRLWKAHRFKGYWELVRAFKLHYQMMADAHMRLAIVGNGDDANTLEGFIEAEKLTEYISIFRNVRDEDLKNFYDHSICLLFPSKREGFGMVYLEAMASKKACIGLKGQPAEEIIVDEKTGLLLNQSHPEELQAAIVDMEINPDKYKKLGEAGYDRYINHFTLNHFKSRFLTSIEEED